MEPPTRAQLGLPEEVHFPPDLFVPLLVPTSTVEQWRHEDAAGSAHAAFALGVLAVQNLAVDEARALFGRAADRGYAEASYALIWITPHQQMGEVIADLEAADDAGSAWAATALAVSSRVNGGTADADAAMARALNRAKVADEQGSADAALILASLESDPGRQVEAYRRADARGSAIAAAYIGGAEDLDGHVDQAISAYLRACNRGIYPAGLRLGELLAQQGRRRAARRVWTQTRAAAVAAGNPEAFSAAQQHLVPPLKQWVRAHTTALVLIFVAAVAMLVVGQWRWDIVLAVGASLFLALRNQPVRGVAFVPVDGEAAGAQSFSSHGVSFSAVTSEEMIIGGPPPQPVIATGWHVAYARISAAAATALVAILAWWAAGRIAFQTVAAWAMFGAALLLATQTIVAFSESMRAEPASAANVDSHHGAVHIHTRIGGPFLSFNVNFGFSEPRIDGILEILRTARPARTSLWIRRLGAVLTAAAGLAAAALLALPAVAPDSAVSLAEVVDITELLVTIWLLVRCLLRIGYVVAKRPAYWGFIACAYTLLALVIAGIAALLGVWSPAALVPGS